MTPFILSDEYYIAVGRLTTAWASVEVPLDFVCGVLYERAGGKTIEDEVPVNLNRKIRFCRKCFGRLDSLKSLAEGAGIILDKTKTLGTERHRVTHGVPDNFTPVPDGTVIMRKIVYEKTRHGVEETRTSVAQIRNIAEQAVALGNTYHLLVSELRKQFGIVVEKLT